MGISKMQMSKAVAAALVYLSFLSSLTSQETLNHAWWCWCWLPMARRPKCCAFGFLRHCHFPKYCFDEDPRKASRCYGAWHHCRLQWHPGQRRR
ncbi:hypothetical protein ACKVWH_011660 [Pyricularia oryzae]